MFVRTKKIKNKDYFYLVRSEWRDGKCHQKVVRYLGKTKPNPQVLADILKPDA
jgi:hypothetical protein